MLINAAIISVILLGCSLDESSPGVILTLTIISAVLTAAAVIMNKE